jgi:hypothetical protein
MPGGIACPKPRPSGLDRREKKRAALVHYFAERQKAFTRDARRCRVCGKPGCETHHIIARSQGGPDDSWNLATVCSNRLDGGCHQLLTSHIVTMRGNADDGPNGLVIEKWDDNAGTYVPLTQEPR